MKARTAVEFPTGWRERKQVELRELIYTASLDLFRAKGFSNVTVERIAAASGVGKGTFFNHFPSKDCVLQEWYRRVTKEALSRVSAQNFSTGCDGILTLCEELTNGITVDPELWDAKCGAASSSLIRNEEEGLDKEVRAFFLQEIESDIAVGFLEPSTNAKFLADLVLTVLTGSGHSWSVAGNSWDLTTTTRDRVKFILKSVVEGTGANSDSI